MGTLIGIENDVCIIGFPKDQTLALETIQRQSNRKFLEALISTLAGKALVLKCEFREGLVVTPPELPETKEKAPLDPKAKAVEDFKNDPKIKKAIEIFEAEILSTK